ncbi:T-complex protein 11-like protein 2 [Aplochiton taeniatus]
MPLNDEKPTSSSSGEDQASDGESSSERSNSVTSSSDMDYSRQSFTSDGSSSPASSPPKTTTLDEVMASARDLSNLSLAHEIIVNRNFQVELSNLPQNSLEKRVRDMVHKAFWDSLESGLNDDPPEYGHAIKLLEEIKEILLSFLNPGANRMRTQIMEVLDIDLIGQQADNEVVDIQGLASYVITVMGKMCAPVRDEEVKKLRESPDNIVILFKEIFRVLDLMKMDVINCTIQSLRPELQRQSVEYERAKFQSILDKTPSALDHTTSWMRSAFEELLLSMNPGKTNSLEKGVKALPGPLLVLNTGFVRILSWDYKSPLPETLMTDEGRLQEIQRQLELLQLVSAILLIVYNAIGEPIHGIPVLADKLKKMTSVLLEGMHSPDFNLLDGLEGASAQICCELNKSLTERNYPALPPALQDTLRGQICSIIQERDPIRTLVEERVQQYFMALLSTQTSNTKPLPVPAGLTVIKPELTKLGANFLVLVNYNKQVYGPFYFGIVKSLVIKHAQTAETSSHQDPTQNLVPSN